MSNIAAAIKQATEAAGAVADEAVTATEGGAIVEAHANSAGQVQTFQKPSMATVQASTGLLPRSTLYLKPTEYGMKIGKNKDMISEFIAELDLVEDAGFMLKHTVRFGNPAQYLSSYDGMACNKGGTWHDAMMKARQADPKAEPYFAAEIKLTLVEALKLKEDNLEAGAVIGYDTSAPSRFSDWQDFYEAAAKAGVVGQKVKVKVVHREINHNGNTWGTIGFELID